MRITALSSHRRYVISFVFQESPWRCQDVRLEKLFMSSGHKVMQCSNRGQLQDVTCKKNDMKKIKKFTRCDFGCFNLTRQGVYCMCQRFYVSFLGQAVRRLASPALPSRKWSEARPGMLEAVPHGLVIRWLISLRYLLSETIDV